MALPFFRKSLQWRGFDLKKATQHLTDISNGNHDGIEERKKAILEHHLKFNAFYNSHVSDKTAAWEDLPILTKADLQQPLHQRLSKGYSTKNVFKGSTSGSSGHPFSYAKDKFAHATAWASFDHFYQMHGIDLDYSLQARFYGIPLSGAGRYKELFKDLIANRQRFPIFNMSDEVLGKFVKQFEKKPFEYINGYTSSIVLFANYCDSNKTKLKKLCPTLKACIVTSEMLFPDDRKLLERVFDVPILNEYGASEVGLIAMQDETGMMRINDLTLCVEIVDDENKPVENGEIGNIIVSDLYNKAHPFIRYAIGDIGSIVEDENGHLYLKELQGRTSDVARFANGKVIPGLTFYYVTKSVISDDSNVKEFIVIQKSHELFEIEYVADQPLTDTEKSKVEKKMLEYTGQQLSIEFTRLPALDRSKRGKLKQFTTLI
ncbi:phenylacetate--CoA ligase family protein [Nonlabens ponticola]|uniref:Phenylacetate--CoA ligase family protein n=1 Tax=Nonlabens ponticola TaxID=2496866 RepID=A0A3S9MVG9_9FLAO|nr:phenylacetate--CoA ligase family protein [Nonlabens ponticola]AZQ43113.1 phenylacetate--CoA ligase family protein [Nonlabens ponticola]